MVVYHHMFLSCPKHPWTMVIELLNAIVAEGAVLGARWSVDLTGIAPS